MESTIDISRSLEVFGFMSPHELYWLAEQAQKHSRIVEFGSYLGRSTRALCDNTDGKVMAVDDWEGPRDFDAIVRGDKLFVQFTENLGDHIESGKLTSLRIDLTKHEFLPIGEFGVPDMVFIDADHTYESVQHDLKLAMALLGNGGLLCGHDFSLAYPGVLRALLEVVKEPKNSNSIWYTEL